MKKSLTSLLRFKASLGLLLGLVSSVQSQENIAHLWNETQLHCIRYDGARPTVQARNLYHATILMYDCWAVYNNKAETVFLGKTLGNYTCPFDGVPIPNDIANAQHVATSYAMYRLMMHRYQLAPGVVTIFNIVNSTMASLGLNPAVTSINYSDGDPAKLGNYIAHHLIQYGLQDGSNELANHANTYYQPLNSLAENYVFLSVTEESEGNPLCLDPNRWQTVSLAIQCDQVSKDTCIPLPSGPPHLTPEWGNVVPFALKEENSELYFRDGGYYRVYHDQGPPPLLDMENPSDFDSFYKWGMMMVPVWQAQLDPDNGVMKDISPAGMGNNQWLPEVGNFEQYQEFYNFEGGDNSPGHAINPKTGLPYESQIVKYGDWARVLAEFWADGPASETPPGHWFSVVNHAVFEHPDFEWKWMGEGDPLNHYEYMVKTYLALGGALHDAAITCWSHKGYYDYARPVTGVRWMADRGQSTDPNLPNYHPQGYPLVPNHSELVMPGDPLAGPNNEHLYKVKIRTWMGPPYISYGTFSNGDPNYFDAQDHAGTDWILAGNWWPYQRPTFVSPPFAGYMSGHSTYSRTAAEVLTLITGDPYFPGGMSNFVAEQNEFLVFEEGPSETIIFQWATYRDASDQCSLSRVFGGIHPVQDDIPGRHLGIILGPQAVEKAETYYEGVAKVDNIEFTANIINSSFVGNTWGATITFNRPMDQSVAPELNFPGSDVSATLQPAGYAWLDENIVFIEFDVLDSQLHQTISKCQVIGAVGDNGKVQQPCIGQGLAIDTKNPLVTDSAISAALITDDQAGSTLTVSLSFDEPMNTAVTPSISFAGGNPNGTFVLNGTQWTGNTEVQINFSVVDANVEVEALVIEVSALTDLALNPISTFGSAAIQIDTKNPEVATLTANHYLLTDDHIGTETFEIIAIFSEAMDTSNNPIISFPDQNPVAAGALSQADGEWVNDMVYAQRYNVNQGNFLMTDVNVSVGGPAADALGNPMVLSVNNAFFSVDLGVRVNEMTTISGITVFPNPLPAGSVLNISVGENNFRSLAIYDLIGKTVHSESLVDRGGSQLSIQLPGLNAGIYLLLLEGAQTSHTIKLILAE
jgi:hypothetical protein